MTNADEGMVFDPTLPDEPYDPEDEDGLLDLDDSDADEEDE